MSTEDYDKPISKLSEDDRLKCFVEWHKLSSDAFAEQNERIKRDLLIAQDPKNAWDDEAYKYRKGRPMLSVSISGGAIKHVDNQAAAAHFGIDLKPVNEKATTKLAETKKGMFARIQRDGGAHQARMWGFRRASRGGLGWYRITTAWDEDSDNPSDQEIVYERILYQENVLPDPAATKADFSDGRFLIVGGYVPYRDFKRQYPNAKRYEKADFAALADKMPAWVNLNGKDHDPLVVEVFYKEYLYEDVKLGDYERRRERPVVRRAVCNGCEILGDKPWLADKDGNGRQYIPFVPVVGDEQVPADGKRYWVGMIRDSGAIDAQKAFNYGISKMVEDVASSSNAKYIMHEGQIEGHQDEWDAMNIDPRPYLLIKGTMLDQTTPAPPPQLVQVDGTKMQLSMLLVQQMRELGQTALQGYEPMEVPKRKAEQSGRAILALEQKSEAGRNHYGQNFKDISLPLDARIVLDAMPVVYDRPGRVIQILAEEDETRPIMLGRPFVVKDGLPIPVAQGTDGAEYVDLSEGKYAIVPVMGKAPQTRLEEGQEFMMGVISAAPELLNIGGDIAFRYRDEPGAKEMADRLQRQIRQTMPWLLDDKENSGEKAKAEVQTLKAQMQQLTQIAQQMAEELKTEQAKQQATLQKAQMDNETKLALAKIDQLTELLKAQLKGQQEAAAKALDHAQETQEHDKEMAHEVGLAAAGGNTTTRTSEQGQDSGQEQGMEETQGRSRETGQEAENRPEASE